MKQNLLPVILIPAFLSSAAIVGCSSSDDDNPVPVVPSDSTAGTVEGQFGLNAQKVREYFASVIKGGDAVMPETPQLNSADVAQASAYVWSLWKAALLRNVPERLATLTSHYDLEYWDDLKVPDGSWKLPDGKMDYFYSRKGAKPAGGYPMFLFMHGSGDDSKAEWTTSIGWVQVFSEPSSVYFIPKSPLGGTGCRWYQPSRQDKWEQLLKLALVSDEIDPARIYFMGISEGGYGAQRLASFYADYLAGAGPIAAGEVMSYCPPENCANIAYCLQTGDLDTSYGRNLLSARYGSDLDKLAAEHPGYYTHKVDLQPEKDHSCDYTVTTPWLVDYSRNTAPKYVHWENFGLGGINGESVRYRDCFYNLYIVEPSDSRTDDLTRTAYDMTVNGNTIDLRVDNVTLSECDPVTTDSWSGNVGFDKKYTPATSGKVRIYLSDALVDLSNPVVVKVNGVEKFNDTVTPGLSTMIESCALFFDPCRVFTASVEVSVN